MKSLIKSILLATMFLTLGCTKQESEYYYSVSEIYKEIESANLQSCGCRLAIFVNEQNNKI